MSRQHQHKWSAPLNKWRPARHQLPKGMECRGMNGWRPAWLVQRTPPQYCVKCGACTWRTAKPNAQNHRAYWNWFRPWGGVVQRVHHIPICWGLPSSYDAPVGA